MKPREKSAIGYSAVATHNHIPKIIPVSSDGRRLQNARSQDIRHTGSRALILLESYFIECSNNIDHRPQQAHHVFGISYCLSLAPSLSL